jgi:16S rRNA (adenine1518-N6/adenine1519-N6)-dimethyltransferase
VSAPARKRFGQHFLHDRGLIERILSAVAPRPDEAVVEIGPGRGALSCPLLARTGALDVIELDRDLAPVVAERCGQLGKLRVHVQNALHFDFRALAAERGHLRIVGNLPYNISTALLFHVLAQGDGIRDMHFMLQKEVVDRMTAHPGTRDYGRLTVMLGYRCRVERLFRAGPGAFTPAPKVWSAFVRLTPHPHPPVEVYDERTLNRVVTRAFSGRRKTLRNALGGLLEDSQIRALGIAPDARPDTLTLAQYARLANALQPLQPSSSPS